MQFICMADLHLRESNPRYRKDQFQVAQYKKVKWILDQSLSYRVPILIAGDVFNSPKTPYSLTNTYMEVFGNHPYEIFAVAGQHDLRYHVANIENTPLGTLSIGVALSLTGNKSIQMAGWNEKIPKEGKLILLTHRCVTKDAPPFFLEDAISAETMLRNHPNYRFIISGDYHVPHTTEIKGRWLINSGSVMRSNKDQQDHKPRVYLVDTEKNTVKPLFIPIEPASKVFDFAAISREDKTDRTVISDFIQAIQVKSNRPNFPKILEQVVKKANPNKSVHHIINTTMEESYDTK